MKIGIDARILQASLRGQGQYVYYLVKRLIAIEPRNEYRLFYNGFRKGRFLFDEKNAYLKQIWCRIPGNMLKMSWRYFSFPRLENFLGRIDIFHNSFNFSNTFYAPIPSRAPMVTTFHGMADPRQIWAKPDEKELKRWLETIARRSRRIIAVSELAARDLLRRVTISKERIRVVYHGVDSAFRVIDDRTKVESVLAKYGLANRKYVLYIGASDKNKNLSGLLRAFKNVIQKHGDKISNLVFVGPADEGYDALKKESKSMGFEREVIFTGFAAHDDLPYIYNGACLFVMPTFYEWFGIPVVEAMACGIPVVASKNTGALEVANDAAVTFDPFDTDGLTFALNLVLADKALRACMIKKGLAVAGKLTWDRMARETLKVYEEALS